jgi:N-formylglutamate amidohydrolase
MSLRPFILTDNPATPLVVSSPHSGRIYPADFAFSCPQTMLRLEEDAYVDEFATEAAACGASVLVAEFPRSLIDLNRAESDLDPRAFDGPLPVAAQPEPATLQGFGLIRRVCRSGAPIYRAPLPAGEALRRLETYYRPYHVCLAGLVAARLQRHGACLLIDLHSMPDFVDQGVPRADFVLGNLDGASCGAAATDEAAGFLRARGYSVALNAPYKGREIVRRYGLGGQGAQALQVEMNRRLYLDETKVEKTPAFVRVRDDMRAFFAHMAQGAASGEERLAAE